MTKPKEYVFLFFFTITLYSSVCSHLMLDLSPSLQVSYLLAYHCHRCALKACAIDMGEEKSSVVLPGLKHLHENRKENRPPSVYQECFTCHAPQMGVGDSTAELYNSRQHVVCLWQ